MGRSAGKYHGPHSRAPSRGGIKFQTKHDPAAVEEVFSPAMADRNIQVEYAAPERARGEDPEHTGLLRPYPMLTHGVILKRPPGFDLRTACLDHKL